MAELLDLLDTYLGSSSWFPFLLLGMGAAATVALGFPQLRLFSRGFSILFGKGRHTGKGDTTPLQALSAALSGTVGTGNIGGVGFALFIGGPGALFWMWVTAALGMALKMTEVILSHRYRTFLPSGEVSGGPMYVLDRALGMRWLAVAFAIFTIGSALGTGNMPQSNNIATSVADAFDIPTWLTGAVLAAVLAAVIMGGIHTIAKMAEALVPTMALLYFAGTMTIILFNFDNILSSFAWIFDAVFNGSAAYGGFLGATFAMGFERGVQRGIFSNEAGQGSAAMAHATSDTESPVEEGIVALLEPFIDTLIICSLTGLAILASGVWHHKYVNEVDRADMRWLQGQWEEGNDQHAQTLVRFIREGSNDQVKTFTGKIEVFGGRVRDPAQATLLAARSIPEELRFYQLTLGGEKILYTGNLDVEDGWHPPEVRVEAKTRVHSVTLTNKAFESVLGKWGVYLVTVCLIMFAFTSAVTWSYYGSRAWIWLLGEDKLWVYKAIYVAGFFAATVIDTSLIWKLANISIVLMALPNLLAVLLLLRKVRAWTREYLGGDKQLLIDEIARENGASR